MDIYNTPTLINSPCEYEIPIDCRPVIDGTGSMVEYAFTHCVLQPIGIYDENNLKETTALYCVVYIKSKGIILATIPMFYKFSDGMTAAVFKPASFSIFQFKNDSRLTAMKEWLIKLIKTF